MLIVSTSLYLKMADQQWAYQINSWANTSTELCMKNQLAIR